MNETTQLTDEQPNDELNEGKKLPTIDHVYEAIKQEESREADPEEIIPVGNITEDDVEYKKLTYVGVDPENIKGGKIKRKQLLEAGFVFNNTPLGRLMEKPLIKAIIDGVDYGKRKLLTKEELATIQNYQAVNGDSFKLEGTDIQDLRRDMIRFLMSASDPRTIGYLNPVAVVRRVWRDGVAKPALTTWDAQANWEKSNEFRTASLDQKLVNMHWSSMIEQAAHAKGVSTEEFNPYDLENRYMAERCKDLYPWDDLNSFNSPLIRGRKVLEIESRKTALNYLPSPFLDSGFHFLPIVEIDGNTVRVGNPDFTVEGDDGVFRVNMMVFHLLSRGLSEMGDSSGRSYDQDYTIGNYIKNLYPGVMANPEEDLKFQASQEFDPNDLNMKIRRRVIDEAKKWAESEDAPRKAKGLVEKTKKIESRRTKSWLGSLFSNKDKS
jgi:hypothetical protein